jgi:hypothetical protein
MKIYYGLTADGRHLRASALSASKGNELSPDERELLCAVFQWLCLQKDAWQTDLNPPRRIGSYTCIRVGSENGECFAEYANRHVS